MLKMLAMLMLLKAVETPIPLLLQQIPWLIKWRQFEDIIGVTTNSDYSNGVEADVSNMETTITASPTPTLKIHKDHPKSQIIGHVNTPIETRNKSKEMEEQSFIATIHQKTNPALLQFCLFSCFLSQEEPKKISDVLQDPSWVEAMIKWVLKNKKDKRGVVIRNKARLVAQGHTQKEGINYDEVFVPVARIEASYQTFLAYASFMRITVYQMDVKSAFLYGTIDEEVYVIQPPVFYDPEFPARMYKVEKAMYGLHQAPRAWYGTLSKYLLTNGFQRGTIDQTLFIIRHRGDFILVQVYVDDIIFGSSNPQLCREFEALMHEKFQMSAMGELNFFIGLQVIQKKDGIFLSQDKYVGDILKKFRYSDVKSANTPMDKENPWGKDETGKDVDLHHYRSMIGSLIRLISWQCKKQTIVATSRTEAEYVATASCCGQVMWIQNQLVDYGGASSSGHEETFWVRRKKSAGKVFRRRPHGGGRRWGGGRRSAGGGKFRGDDSIIFCSFSGLGQN
uniref:Putative ribonuclease H-like domain-containing protein n=1 Tax=Tanacetum cinerariifolium TaxID=118510 RepID=A0A6L2M0U8_TANCI|nr:putative ribonuclease H-like domain-containing protein [Tanacetum cinerariifolium]